MAKKISEKQVAADFQIWSKIECTCPVKYVDANMAS